MLRRANNDNLKKRREPSSGEMNGIASTISDAHSFSPSECVSIKKPHIEATDNEETDRAQNSYSLSLANNTNSEQCAKSKSESLGCYNSCRESEMVSDDSDEEKKQLLGSVNSKNTSSSPSFLRASCGDVTPNSRARSRLCLRTASQKQIKRLVLKSPLNPPTIPHDFQEQIWARLKAAIHAIHARRKVEYSLEGLYAGVEDICSQNLSEDLYNHLIEELDAHLKSEQSRLISETAGLDSVQFLRVINKTWQDHCEQTILIRSIFLTLDRRYACASTTIHPIWDVGLSLFRQHVITLANVQLHIQQGLLEMIERERNAELVDRSLLKNIIRMYISLGLYKEFEAPFMEATEVYYKAESMRYIQELGMGDYLLRVESRLAEEADRVKLYLDPLTSDPLIAVVETTMITEKLDHILNEGFVKLFNEDSKDDITRMYVLLGRINAHKQMRITWNKCIKDYGSALVQDTGKDDVLIDELLAFKVKLESILNTCFEKNSDFAYSLKEAFEFAINSRQNVPSELLAKFLDKKLKSTMSDSELEGLLADVIHLFRYLNSKDVFEAFARRDLAKRLLLQKNLHTDAEKSLIMSLKSECGALFTSKMEGMLKDIDLSKELSREFSQYLVEQDLPPSISKIDTTINILTTGHWPSYNPIQVNLPPEFTQLEQAFTSFYEKRFSGRYLIWLNTHCHTTLKSRFSGGQRELSVSLFQTVICLLFNDVDALSYESIKASVGLADEDELKRTLLSLCLGKHRLLIRKPASSEKSGDERGERVASRSLEQLMREIRPSDMFVFNKNFTSKMIRIKINQIQLKETKVEQEKTQEGVIQNRLYQTDAAIVRIMKARKTLSHNQLISELVSVLKFPTQAPDLKKRIEVLIEQEYISRDPQDPTVYNYVS
ncbi:cullin-4A-like [Schistocerca gregaria]|uniref:cullin-4A-like n=1 Tax=Schistocerca gregaria TaxID=7010 RepID=UPI00211E6C23|nr:cullin-4A-like [Schistocerca gregaria]